MTHYHQVSTVVDAGVLTDAVRWVQDKVWVDRLESTIEAHTMAAAQVREACTIPGTSVRTAWLCRDKPSMKEALRAAGVPTAASAAVTSAAEVHGVRRRRSASRSSSSRAPARARSTPCGSTTPTQLDEALGRFGGQGVESIAVEEFVEGHEGFYDTVSVDGHAALDFVVALLPERARGDAHPLDLAAVRLDQPGRLRRRLPGAARARRPRQRRARHRHQRHPHGVVLRAEGPAVLRDRLPAARRRGLGPLLGGQRPRPLPRLGGRDRARARRRAAVPAVRHRDRRAAARPRRPHQRLLRRRRGPGPAAASG